MDIFSHGLYGGIAFGRRSRPRYWLAFFFGIAPDLFSFGLFFVLTLLNTKENARDFYDFILRRVESAKPVTDESLRYWKESLEE
ncbi:MAG: hypothetical protein WAT81_02400 [Candidatus Moraniibacteriota bacterium]